MTSDHFFLATDDTFQPEASNLFLTLYTKDQATFEKLPVVVGD